MIFAVKGQPKMVEFHLEEEDGAVFLMAKCNGIAQTLCVFEPGAVSFPGVYDEHLCKALGIEDGDRIYKNGSGSYT